MDDEVEYAGRLLAGRYRLPRRTGQFPDACGSPAYDTASGQEVLATQVPLPEVVEAEFLDDGADSPAHAGAAGGSRRLADPAVRRAVEAARAASRIPDHPRLDQVYDVFVDGDELWVVSELLPAQPVSELIARQPLAAHRAAEIAADVLAALRAVHAHGWVHRNITADTVLVCEDGRAMLTGLAVGVAQEALCGHDPLPDASQTAAAPRGAISPPAGPGPGPGPRTDTTGPDALRKAAQPPLPAGFRHRPEDRALLDRAHPDTDVPSRAERSRALAAYRAGARAATAEVEARAAGRDGQGPAAPEAPGASENASAEGPYGPRGRPYGEGERDPHGPTALPGPRPGTSHAVPTPWTKRDEPLPAPADTATGDAEDAGPERYRGPGTALAAERARHARMATVGAVTERWAPEQAGPVHEHWRLAPPVGPAADLWALGALLFRAVQGHAPYPEEDVAELVQMVCAEPPAYAEECGPLRPVVESLLRQDPVERPDFEVLRGWLRSLIRSAPEPDVGRKTLVAPPSLTAGRPSDPRRLPILRRKGELVRRNKAGRRAGASRGPGRTRRSAAPAASRRTAHPAVPLPDAEPPRRDHRTRGSGSPRALGRYLLGGVLLLLTAAVLYAMWFMPERNQDAEGDRRSSVGSPEAPSRPSADPEDAEEKEGEGESPAETQPQTSEPAAPADGFRLHEDPTGFRVAVPEGWKRLGPNAQGQVRFEKGDFRMTVVRGRDTTKKFGSDPMAYQSRSEPELRPYRASDWSSASGLRRIDVGDTAMAEGTYTWPASDGGDVYVRNRAMILDGRYHLLLVQGPQGERKAVDRWFEGAVDTYRVLPR